MKAKLSEILLAALGTLCFLLFVLPIFMIWIPSRILSSSGPIYFFDIGVFRYLGIVPIAAGIVICIWCSINFIFNAIGTPIPFTPTKKLIVAGLYRFVRNPLYIAGCLVLAGEALLFQCIGIIIYGLIMWGNFYVLARMEETLLEEKFGAAYQHYFKSVPRWIPRLKPYRDRNESVELATSDGNLAPGG